MIIWIASYPKSGNTWVRSFLSHYFFSNEEKFSFDSLRHIPNFNVSNFIQKKELIKSNAFITFGFILFIILIADKLGFFLTILLFTFVTPLLWQRKDKFYVLLYSIGMTVFVFVFFTLVLQLKFPQGILENFIVRTFY